MDVALSRNGRRLMRLFFALVIVFLCGEHYLT